MNPIIYDNIVRVIHPVVDRTEAVERERDKLKGLLERVAVFAKCAFHNSSCDVYTIGGGHRSCTCGLTQLQSEITAALADKEENKP